MRCSLACVGLILCCLSCGPKQYAVVGNFESFHHSQVEDLIASGYNRCQEPNQAARPHPHVTLKYTFEFEDIGAVERIIEEVAHQQPPFSITLTGYDEFAHFEVLYLKVMSDLLFDLHIHLLARLNALGVSSLAYDTDYIPHLTIAQETENKACFIEWFNELRAKDEPWPSLTVNSISLGYYDESHWVELKRYPLREH
ncbi:MAG: hypothetical protein A2284_17025 [Deltaproteobacteria bacterium RIFOXYA12_FULL_61_11]|nr:MAG: hypothetical protein A2284_17025 [Deltaproteobacteria bacterium RIFOXYA12_FULL_61_11]